jgi:hypothetical protein
MPGPLTRDSFDEMNKYEKEGNSHMTVETLLREARAKKGAK